MYCAYCGQEFSRTEHLERHVLSHTNVKPHKCATCHLSFGRQDLLQRHRAQVHTRDGEATDVDTLPIPRQIACSSCAKAKIKCDKVVPACGRCISKGLQCQPRTSQHSSEAALQAVRQLDQLGRLSNGPSADRGNGSVDSLAMLNSLQEEEGASDQGNSPSSSESPPSSAHKSPQRRQQPNHMLSFNNGGPTQDSALQWTGTPQDGLNERQIHGAQSMQLAQAMPLDPYPASAFEGYNPSDDQEFLMDDHSFDMTFRDMSNYMVTDPIDPNLFHPPPLLTESPSSDVVALVPVRKPATMTMHRQELFVADFEGWPCFVCNPSSVLKVHPRTGRMFLEGLEHTLKNHDSVQLSPLLVREEGEDRTFNAPVKVEPFISRARDKLMVITQSILHKARKVHGSTPRERLENDQQQPPDDSTGYEVFSTLPSTHDLEHLLQSYANRYEPYYPSIPSRILSPVALLESAEERCSSLLLLLMLAQGAGATPTKEARYFTSGLTEACRLSWFSLADKDVNLTRDPVMLRSALMFVNLAAWSGDKWHMDLAAASLDLYISILRYSGLLGPSGERALRTETSDHSSDWKTWKDFESGNRLAYSWVVADQELSLFYDRPPKLPIAELNAAIPDQDALWRSRSADEWSRAYNAIYSSPKHSSPRNPPSLKHIFRRFMSRDPRIQALDFSPTQLRLFLQPLQASVCHLHECLDCFSDVGNDRQSKGLVAQLEETQSILQDWYAMCSRAAGKDSFDPATCANLVTYHLICLNTMTHFRELERFARGELQRDEFRQSYWAKVRGVEDASRIWYHCGQVLRLVRAMPAAQKPPWWSAAIYRVAMMMWGTSHANMKTQQPTPTSIRFSSDDTIVIDGLTPEHPAIVRFVRYREGVPVLSRPGGGVLSLEMPENPLLRCLEVLSDEPASTKLAEGIKARLTTFIARQHELR